MTGGVRYALAVAVVCLLTSPIIATNAFWANTSSVVAINAVLALSVGLTYGQCGVLSLAQGAFAAMGAYASAILCARYAFSPWTTLPVSMVLPGLVALPVAWLVSPLSPLVLALATLTFSAIIEILLRSGGDLTGGFVGLSGLPPLFEEQAPVLMHVVNWMAVAAVVLFYANLVNSAWGRAINTIRHDQLRAKADGADVSKLQGIAFSLGAGLAGLGGWLYAHQLSFISPELFGTSVSINAILMAVVGGVSHVVGPVAGAIILSAIYEVLPGQQSRGMFYGTALILTLLLAPRGLLGLNPSLLLLGKLRKADDVQSPSKEQHG